jgi:hypothetical protein
MPDSDEEKHLIELSFRVHVNMKVTLPPKNKITSSDAFHEDFEDSLSFDEFISQLEED